MAHPAGFAAEIQIRAKSAAHGARHNHPTPMPITISLKASDSILGQKESKTWGDMSWKFRPPVEIHADSEVSIVVSPAPSATTQLDDEQVLATITFADVPALPQRNSRQVHLQLEHELATVRISFTVSVNQGTPVPLRDSLKRRFLRHFRALFGVDERSDFAPATAPPASDVEILEQQPVPSARPGWLRPSVGEHVRPPRTQVLEDSEYSVLEDSEYSVLEDSEYSVLEDSEYSVLEDSEYSVLEDSEYSVLEDSEYSVLEDSEDSGNFEDFIPQESHTHTENDFNAVPVDSGKIQYTVVGTQRPKPR
ncbi:hypothetical protein EYR38_003284 [Pleurotus pulmonarius]|nr:hypothetical protein EYR38_003284 [Pleurotus pulmonarius]